MIRQSLFLALSITVSLSSGEILHEGMEIAETLEYVVPEYVKENCGHEFACDNEIAQCSSHSQCVNPSGEALSGCCIPKGMDPNEMRKGLPIKGTEKNDREGETKEWEHLRGSISDYVFDNCGPAFACDSIYGCADHSQCVNPSGETLSGCCIPDTMDPNEIKKGLPIQSADMKISEWEHLRGIVADYVIDNCGPAFACDNANYGCADHSQCINPSGEMLSGCCIPNGMDFDQIEKGLSTNEEHNADVQKKMSEWEHLRGIVADYVIDHCGPAFACDNTDYGCADHSQCVNPSGGMLSGCCIPNGMDPNNIKKGISINNENVAEQKKMSEWEHLRGVVADYVIDNCGPAFACDNADYGCADHSQCINPSEETLSGCCIPNGMDPNEMKKGLPLPSPQPNEETQTNGPSSPLDYRGLVADYVMDHCGHAFACDNTIAGCGENGDCINPSGEPLSGCCVPKGMRREDLEGVPSLDSFDFTSLNGIDLSSVIDPYVKENCGPAFACDDNVAHCGADASCINPSSGLLTGCCVPNGMTKEELETGILTKKTEEEKEEEEESSERVCSASIGQCLPSIPRVFMANETKRRDEL